MPVRQEPCHDIDNLDHDPKLAEALGNMVVAWARAETALVQVFSLVAGVHFNMATVACARIPTFESRTKVIRAMLKEWNVTSDRPKDLDRAITKLSGLSRTRNTLIHGIWCREKESGKTVLFDLRSEEGTPGRRRLPSAHDVANHSAAVRKRTEEIERLVPTHGFFA